MYASTGCSGYSGVTGFDAQHEDRAAELRARQQRDEPARSRTSAPEYPSVPPQYPHSTPTVPTQYPGSSATSGRGCTRTHRHALTNAGTHKHTRTRHVCSRAAGVRTCARRAGAAGVLEGVLWGYSKGYCGGTQGASYYKHGTGPAAPARDVLMLGRRRELLPRDRLADLRRRAEDSSTAKSGTGGVRRRATW